MILSFRTLFTDLVDQEKGQQVQIIHICNVISIQNMKIWQGKYVHDFRTQ